ncbi:Edeine non-ribosomal peptide synthetase EdeJ [Brevibacillus sp. IT-7CA2]|uniref:edeine non-ribosomal peptide synthetase EdeJ n=1 Tax=Brevibacillus sp. IT-7CA2 TaxID=3026436 RepID=UPI0039E1410B
METTISQNILLTSRKFSREEQYWHEKLQGEWTLSLLPTEGTEKEGDGVEETKEISFVFPDDLNAAVTAHCDHHPMKLYLFLLSTFQIMLNRYKQTDDMIILTPVFQNPLPPNAWNRVLPLRVRMHQEATFAEVAKEGKQLVKEAIEHQNYPFSQMMQWLDLSDTDLTTLLDTAFVLENMQDIAALEGLSLQVVFAFKQTEDGITGRVRYAGEQFQESVIERMISHYQQILRDVVVDPKKLVNTIDMLTEAERTDLLYTRNQTDVPHSAPKPIHQLIEEQAASTPHLTAAVFGNKTLTYAQLNGKANYLARMLKDSGIGRGSYVPVLMNRSLNLVISLLAVMKTGAAFVPLDVQSPNERKKQLLDELDCPVTLIGPEIRQEPSFVQLTRAVIVDADDIQEEGDLKVQVDVDDPIYVIYTSGSTGKPKGAVVPHIGIFNRFRWMDEHYGCTEQDAIFQTTPHHYDSSVWQLFWPLLHGGRTVLPIPEFEMTLDQVLHAISTYQITITDFVPSVFNLLVDQMETRMDIHDSLSSIRHLILGGEEITAHTVHLFLQRFPHVRITNLYGPTETSIGVIYFEIDHTHQGPIPIGKPIANTKILLLDSNRKLVPAGQQGEIYITGLCLGHGYLHDPEKTAASFVDNPYPEIGYQKLYRTGDLGRYLPNGNIKFCGRIDHQVKVRGHRIELGEIDEVLLSHPLVKECAVLFQEEKARLCAYYVSNAQELTASDLRGYLSERLPDHMIPSFFVSIEKMPLTAGGKINRKLLPEVDEQQASDTEYVAPRNEKEEQLVTIWKEILGIEKVGVHDSFFQLGGNSLLLLKMHAQIVKQVDSEISVAHLFSYYTIAMFVDFLEQRKQDQFASMEDQSDDDESLLELLREVKEGVLSVDKGAELIDKRKGN